MATWLLAGLIGLVAESGLFIGALVGYTERLPHRVIATVMGFSIALVAGFFLANIPQGISSASGMHHAGRSRTYVLGVWAIVVGASTAASIVGAVAFVGTSDLYQPPDRPH